MFKVGTCGIGSSWISWEGSGALSFRDEDEEVLEMEEVVECVEIAFAFEKGDSRGWSKSMVRPWTEPARVRSACVGSKWSWSRCRLRRLSERSVSVDCFLLWRRRESCVRERECAEEERLWEERLRSRPAVSRDDDRVWDLGRSSWGSSTIEVRVLYMLEAATLCGRFRGFAALCGSPTAWAGR
jgi:hypothetical protein